MALNKRHINEMKRIVEAQELTYTKISKTLEDLSQAGYIFIKNSDHAYWGDKSVRVTSSLDGEDWLNEVDPE